MGVILITGTSTGIGFETSVTLGRAGHDVFASMRDPSRAPALQNLAANERLPITILPLDVTDAGSVSRAVQQVIAARHRIDVLINNAGVAPLGAVEDLPLSEFHRAMETNYFGPLRCIQAVLPGMRQRRSGWIVNISSVSGRIASAGHSAYAASKFALEAMSEALAAEVKAYNVRVAIVEPGVIQTPAYDKVGTFSAEGPYPQARRLNALFSALLQAPVAASVVGERVREIIAGDSWQLRYPVGPGAAEFIGWRASLSDEDFVNFGAMDETAWCGFVLSNFGVDVKPYLASRSVDA